MPTTLTTFTTYAEIRAVLGVATTELDDTVLALPLYLTMLQGDFQKISPLLEQKFLDTLVVALPTALEQRFLAVTQAYSAYATAKNLLTSLPLFAPKQITDGRASVDRFPDPWLAVTKGVLGTLEDFQEVLEGLLPDMGITPTPKVVRKYTGVAGLYQNPVTGV